ncbi:hypothetical protein T11_9913 [Trichinella zimbabwensis]|uniref:Uncharacterized protein n=1 Tax=Trichinella zimbabwensis TaxID=268475 RepID=A0A0V1I627_9BILA|nr:hypothetical protein T11_9913 [Trichinella zimbabwensis]
MIGCTSAPPTYHYKVMRLFLNRRSDRRLHKRNRFSRNVTITSSEECDDEKIKLWKALTNQIDQNEIFSRPALLGTAVLLASKVPQLHVQSWICNDDDNDVSKPLGALFQL